MRGSDKFNLPRGQIGMYMHRGGIWLPAQHKLSDDGKLLKSFEDHNLIVYSASTLMAQRMAPGATAGNGTAQNAGVIGGDNIANGLQWLAVGLGQLNNGVQTWNLQDPPTEQISQQQLFGELMRKQFTSWSFLDGAGNATSTATNILQLVTMFMESEAVGALVEMGIFGGTATSAANTGTMFNYKTFPVWNKPSDARLTITWQLTF